MRELPWAASLQPALASHMLPVPSGAICQQLIIIRKGKAGGNSIISSLLNGVEGRLQPAGDNDILPFTVRKLH